METDNEGKGLLWLLPEGWDLRDRVLPWVRGLGPPRSPSWAPREPGACCCLLLGLGQGVWVCFYLFASLRIAMVFVYPLVSLACSQAKSCRAPGLADLTLGGAGWGGN